MSGGSSTPSKIKVGRLWGYPIIVTTGKSTHEAILLDCNTDDPQEFLNKQIDVKIRWKVAGYNDTVPARDVVLQNVDTLYYLPRKAALAASAAQGPTKKRKVDDTAEDNKPSTVSIKKEEIETDNEEDNEKPAAVTSGTVKEEEVETDNDDYEVEKPSAVTSSIKKEEVETDENEEDTKQPNTSNLKIEEVETDDDDDDDSDRKPGAVNKSSGDTFKETENEVDLVDLTAADDKEEEEKEVDMVDLTVTDEEEDSRELSASSVTPPRAASRTINWAELGLDDSSDEEMGGEEVSKNDNPNQSKRTTLVEFKFCSINSFGTTGDYELEGTLHIPMYQDATTGIYTLPIGRTVFKGKLDRDEYNEFEGCFVKFEVVPDDDSSLIFEGDKCYSIKFDLGLNLTKYERGWRAVYPRENNPALLHGCRYIKSSPLNYDSGLGEWEKNQGGELVAYEDGRFMKKSVALYTVLSVHKANEESPSPLPEGYEADWNFLVNAYHARLKARDDEDDNLGYAQAAVKEYRHFLALKAGYKGKGDTKSAGYSPSKQIDDVWHTHISFLRRYQCDTLYLTRGKKVIEHSPVLSDDSRLRYNKAYYAHSKKMSKEGRSVDSRFWNPPYKFERRRYYSCSQCG